MTHDEIGRPRPRRDSPDPGRRTAIIFILIGVQALMHLLTRFTDRADTDFIAL